MDITSILNDFTIQYQYSLMNTFFKFCITFFLNFAIDLSILLRKRYRIEFLFFK